MCPSCGRDIDPGTEDLGPQFTAMQCGQCGDSWRWSDAGADAFSLVLARCVGSMTPVEDQYSPEGLPRAARFNLCLAIWYRVDGDPAWRRGTTANLSRSGVLFRASGVGAFCPQRRTDPHRPSEIVIEVSKGAIRCQVHCHATARASSSQAPETSSVPSPSLSATTSSSRTDPLRAPNDPAFLRSLVPGTSVIGPAVAYGGGGQGVARGRRR